MRFVGVFLCLIALGCGGSQAQNPSPQPPPRNGEGEKQRSLAPPLPVGEGAGGRGATPLPDPPTRKSGSDWPVFLGPTGDSVSSEKGILSPWPEKGPRIVWHKEIGTGYAMPVISRGRLFLFDRQGTRATLNCWKSETGEPLWKFDYPTDYRDMYGYNGGPRCCPVVDDDRVYIYGVEGMLHCVRVADGKPVWKVDTRAEFGVVQNFFGVGSTPVVEGDLLIVQVGGSPKGSERQDFADLKGNGSGVVAFDKLTGKVRYKITDELASYASPVLATINGRRWCFVLARGGLIGFEPASGKVDFHFPWRAESLESVSAANPVVVGDQVFISETYGPGGALLQVRPGGHKVLWTDAEKRRDKSMQCHWMTPIYKDGYLYGCSGRHENADLRCIELATGKVMWRQQRLLRTSLLMVDGHFVCLSEEGILYLLKVNPQRYEEVSRVELREAAGKEPLLREPCWAAPILAHGLLYVRGNDRLVCLELIPAKKE
ncbi:MAG TPA: PQQ-binding-like beta-propeller repeat protein [Gemmataceae bacterium]|nr:PQQ-binding-like beta-propeller repeat protein [Gemmataceae bacterium]